MAPLSGSRSAQRPKGCKRQEAPGAWKRGKVGRSFHSLLCISPVDPHRLSQSAKYLHCTQYGRLGRAAAAPAEQARQQSVDLDAVADAQVGADGVSSGDSIEAVQKVVLQSRLDSYSNQDYQVSLREQTSVRK